MYVLEGDNVLVSEFMHKKEKNFNPIDTLILDKWFKYDLENFINTYYPEFSQVQTREAAEVFCKNYAGYMQTYGIIFTENALIQIFF
jgi:hypothetical protein